MSNSIYVKLAWTNLKNNHKTYVPYILTASLTVMMFYIMNALCQSPDIISVSLSLILEYALGTILIFAVIFLFYTNSFLIKRRKKEIGMYNILGMGKSHIARMMTVETGIVMSISIIAGILVGIIFGKLMYLVLLKMLRYNIGMQFGISYIAIRQTVFLFIMIFLVILLYNLMQIHLSNPIEMLSSKNKGEKEPKTKWLLAIIGIVFLAVGYGIALVVEKPLEALGGFFIAVVCVMIGTYALFTAGSIAILKMLKKNKRYYYQTSHFTAVSGMIYRMKQNAAGLANICILSTMVLVMISTTFSLYMGMEDILKYRFPREVMLTTHFESKEKVDDIRQFAEEELAKKKLKAENILSYNAVELNGFETEDGFEVQTVTDFTRKDVCNLTFMALEDYNQLEQKNFSLKENEVLLYSPSKPYEKDTLCISQKNYRIKNQLNGIQIAQKSWYSSIDGYYIIFPNRTQVQEFIDLYNKESSVQFFYASRLFFDIHGDKGERDALETMISKMGEEYPDVREESRIFVEKSFYELYGSLLFIGIYLGFMFLMATVLIIYYKQISEGYDDRERYQIMQKVGMSRKEVKQSIRNQVLTVFFLPLLTAILHNLVAFRIINKLLETLNFVNTPLYLKCTAITICVFAIFYGMIYVVTAREYYKIVNEK